MYKITHEIQSDSFDMHGFVQGEARRRISHMVDQAGSEDEGEERKPDENTKTRFPKNLDQAFGAQHRFTFIDMVVVLFALGKYDRKGSFPGVVNECRKKDLIDFLEHVITVNRPSRDVLNTIVDFVSVKGESLREGRVYLRSCSETRSGSTYARCTAMKGCISLAIKCA